MEPVNGKKYLFAFLITLAVFVMAFLASSFLNQKRLGEMRAIQDQISVDILSSETQFELLGQVSCEDLGNSALSKELNTMAEQLSYMEQNRGVDNPDVLTLKKYYSLLQIKDYVLMQKITEKCSFKPIFILYFYSNMGDCPDCEKTGYVLTRLRQEYPELRIYSFDYNMGLSAINTLTSLYNIRNTPPAMLVNGKVYYGFQSMEDIEHILPGLKALRVSTSTPTTTSASAKGTTTR